jgi:oxygen-independent coproporphyrinogen-3 oxidase
LSAGLPLDVLDEPGRAAVDQVVADELAVVSGERLVLTDRGRLLADAVVRDLLP